MSIYVTDENGKLYSLSGGSAPSENTSNISDDAAKYYENIYEAANKNIISHYYDDCIVTNVRQTIGVLTERQLGPFRSDVLKPILQLRPISEIPSKVHYNVDMFEMIDGNAVEYDMRFFDLEKNTKYTISFSTYINWADTTMFGVTIPVDDTSEHTVEFTTDSHGEYIFEHGFKMLPNEDYAMAVYQFEQICLVKGDYSGLSIQSGDVVTTVDVNVETYEAFKRAKRYTDVVLKNKVDVVEGKSLSTNDYTNEDKTKLADINTQSIDFAEAERQKSKNLFNKDDIIKGYWFVQSGYEPTKESGSEVYFISNYCLVKGLSQVYLSGEKTAGTSNIFYDENKVPFARVSQQKGLIEVPDGAVYMRFNALISDLENDLMLEAGNKETEYQPYNGAIVRDKCIQRVDVFYDVDSGKTILGGLDYGDGISGGVSISNLNFNKYKYLKFYIKYSDSSMNVGIMDLTHTLQLSGERAYRLNSYAAPETDVRDIYYARITLTLDKTNLTLNRIGYYGVDGTWHDRYNDKLSYCIYKIEGVY